MKTHLKASMQCAAISAAMALCGIAAAAPVPVRFDGSYTGTSQLVPGSDASCQGGLPVSVDVTNGRFHFAWRPAQDVAVRIGADGRYSATLRGSFVAAEKYMQVLPRIDGQADGQTLIGEYGTPWCKYTYRLERN